HVWLTPVALAAVALPYLENPALTFVGVASTLTALAGVLLRPARRIVDDWHFRIGAGPDGLVLRHGLLETRVQTLPRSLSERQPAAGRESRRRVQAIALTWPLLWRVFRGGRGRPLWAAGWVQARIDIAGYGGHDRRAETHVDRLLPVATPDTARRVTVEVLGVDPATLEFAPVPARARWVAPLQQPHLGVALGGSVLGVAAGWLTRDLVLVP